MEAIIFALISYLGWGIGDIFGTISSRKIGGYSTTFWVFLLGVIIFSLYIPFALNDLGRITPILLIFAIFLGLLEVAGNTLFNEATRISNASMVGTIGASFTAVTLIFSVIFFGESITQNQIIAAVVIFSGLILITLNFKEFKKSNFLHDKGILFAFIAMICWGSFFTFVKILTKEIGWFWPIYISFSLFPVVYLFMRFKGIKLQKPTYQYAILPLILSTILLRSADYSFNIGLSQGAVALVAPIAGSYPTLFVILAFLFFKDPITRQQILGIITTLAGIVLLSVFSV